MKCKPLYLLLAGALIGVLATGMTIVFAMPSMMLKTHESNLAYDQAVDALKTRIEKAGWVISGIIPLYESLKKQGVDFERRVTLIKLCHPDYAQRILTTDRDISVMMPCTFSVWEDDNGKVYLTQMNTGLMGKLFGGTVAEIMGGAVSRDETAMLTGLLKH
ncbi:MAG TPA: DUF302 domain-containing protein [Phycisphaerales bacterium]|nr:DUF302 domain-containing protein [Phycisphaerales bacterium]